MNTDIGWSELLSAMPPSLGRRVSLDYAETKPTGFGTGGIPPDTRNRHFRFDNMPPACMDTGQHLIKVWDWHSDLGYRIAAADWRVLDRANSAVDSWLVYRACLNSVILIWHWEFFEAPAKNSLKKLSSLSEIVNSKIEVCGFHFEALQLVPMDGRAFSAR